MFLALSLSAPALAWHAAGHKATAAIAFAEMSSARQHEVVAILRAHPRFEADFASLMPAGIAHGSDVEQGKWLFEHASIWPDLIQTLGDDVKTKFHRGRWHYINLPVWLTDEDRQALEGRLGQNLVMTYQPPLRKNLNVVQALRGNLQVWHDPQASASAKAVALCWIIHLTGDMHQPLHTVALFSRRFFPKGDRGGNGIEVQWGDETRNLHAVWDGLPTDMHDLKPSARTIRSVKEDVVNDAAIDDWVYVHASLARKFVYTDEIKQQLLARIARNESPTIELSHEYLVAARSIARRQVNLAGHRIAALLGP